MKIKFKLHHPAYPADAPFHGEIELDAQALADLVIALAAIPRIAGYDSVLGGRLEDARASLFAVLSQPTGTAS